MQISPTETVRLYEVSKPTLYKDMEEGNVSFEFDSRKKRRLNVAELERVYERRKEEKPDLTSNSVKNSTGLTELNGKSVKSSAQDEAVNDAIIQSKDREIQLLENTIEQLKEHNEDLKKYIEETREEHRGFMRILEDKREDRTTGEIFQQQDQRMQEMMNAMDNLMRERQEQNQQMAKLEERIVKIKENGERVFQKLNVKNKRLARQKKVLEEEASKPWFKKLIG